MQNIQMADYARGFLLSPADFPRKVPEWWVSTRFGDLWIDTDPRVSLAIGNKVVFIGHAIHVSSAESDPQAIANRLDAALAVSSDLLQEVVNDLAGRFIVVYEHHGILRLQQDAIGMRSVFFSPVFSGTIAGSHSGLVANQVSTTPSMFPLPEYLRSNNIAVIPGRATEYLHVTALTPNTELSLRTGGVRRIYFGMSSQPLSAEEAAEVVIRNAQVQAEQLLTNSPLYVSLSAGLDSRVTTALLRRVIPSAEFFTYDLKFLPSNPASKHDRDTAVKLAHTFVLHHRLIEVENRHLPKKLKESLTKNSNKAHSWPLAGAYLRELPDGMHIRSNAHEIARAYYLGDRNNSEELTGADMLSTISNGKSKDPAAVKAFDDFIEATSFSQVSNIHPLDLFYWEHRMGAWMVPILLESDIAHDTHILVNHRPTLEALLSVSVTDQKEGKVFDEIIRMEWPELYEIPVNGARRGS